MNYIALRVVVRDPGQARALDATPGDVPLGTALENTGCLLLEPLRDGLATLPLRNFRLAHVPLPELLAGRPAGVVLHSPGNGAPIQVGAVPEEPPPAAAPGLADRPESMDEGDATRLAYHDQVNDAASLLRAGLSVLIVCDKIVVAHLAEHIVRVSNHEPRLLEVPRSPDEAAAPPIDLAPPVATSLRQRLLARLRDLLREVNVQEEVIVITHLDLLGGGADSGLANESRDLIELLYSADKNVLLAFADPSLAMPEVLASRFAVRMAIEGSPRFVRHPVHGTEQPIERSLLTRGEAGRFTGVDTADFYKYVAGLNPVRLRQAIRYAYQETEGRDDVTVADLRHNIRKFKAQQSSSFEIPNVSFDDIGGYDDVKAEIVKAITVMSEARDLPEADQGLRGELIPRGFIFHGEPGTGKTLFAKAIANEMEATIQVVSGPEVTNKYVGESERRIRELFAEARRNAPAVIVFDEFDSIAASRSTSDDGGSRAGNAMVTQILTEMDGFRPDVQMLVIGTTNRLEIIDRALLRPSRFQSFHIGLPDPEARRQIIGVHAARYHIDVTGLVESLIGATKDWNGDEIRALFRDAYVGEHWEKRPADAQRLGELVGHQQRTKRQQQKSMAGRW